MEANKEKAILALDYDDDDSSDEEEDEELFDNSKVDWRVKGILLRGKEFSVSDNGNCPRCQSNVIVFVILDELFPMGDMPEILYNLLAKGKGVLWSSQDKQSCKKAPTFMCRGFCPPDPLGAGFNINWDTVNLTKLLKDLLKLNIAKAQKKLQESEKANENGGEDNDVNEKDIIKAMLAQEKEKEEKPVHGPLKENETPTETSSSETVVTTSTGPVTSSASTSSATTPATYPVSKDGSCPHCGSTAVRYIILIKDSTKDITLPPTLDKLLKMGKAFKMAKGVNSPPSFQCCACTYGFNLDWSKTDLKKIFNLETETSSASTTASATKTKTATKTTNATASSATVSSSTYKSYTSTSYPATSYQNSSYGSYAYTQPPMGYPAPGPYGYPGPAPLMAQAPPMGGMAPPPYGAPIPYAGVQPYPGMPPQPFGATPPPGAFVGPPQPYPGVPTNQFGPVPPGNVPPRGAPMFGMQPNMPANFHGNFGTGTMAGNIPGVMSVNVSSPGVMPGPGPLPGLMQGPGGPVPMPGPGPMQVPGPIPMPGSMPGPVPMAVPGPMQGPGPIPISNPMQGPVPVPGLGPFPGNPQAPGNFPGNVPGAVNMQGMPRLRVPKGPQKGRNKNWKGKWKGQQGHNGDHENLAVQAQWPHVDGGESHEDDDEGTSEDLYDPEAATRFEKLLNKIDDHEHDVDNEDEKPPGEETQAEFEVTAFTPEEKPAVEKIEKNEPESHVKKTQANSMENIVENEPESIVVKKEPESICEKSQANSESIVSVKPESMERDITVNNTSFNEATIKAEPTCDSDLANVSENNGEANVTSQTESKGLEASPARRAKASRGRKRQATGARKKTSARNTRIKKAVEDTVEPEDGIGNNNGTDGLTETGDEKRVKVESEQESAGIDVSMKGETTEDIVPKRVTRARSLRQKK